MVVAGTPLPAGLGWSSQSVLAEPSGELVAITGATIFDATGKDPYRGTVVVRGGRIDAVGADVKAPKGAKIVRADGKALLPGFIDVHTRSEEHTSELQSLMRISYAVFCLKKKKNANYTMDSKKTRN